MTTSTKHALIVGGSAGIGLGVALQLAPLVAKLTICSRSCPPDLLPSIKARNPDVDVVHERLDVSLLHEVRKFTVKHAETDFDWIVLTAGTMSFGGDTDEGLDRVMATVYYGRFMLVHDLLSRLNRPGVRVLNVFHAGKAAATPDLDDLGLERKKTAWRVANACKLYWDLMVEALSEHAPHASFMHINPGFVDTNLFGALPWIARVIVNVLKVFSAKSPDECATNMLKALTNPEYTVGWQLLDEYAKGVPKTKYHSDELKSAVWEHTLFTIDNVLKQ